MKTKKYRDTTKIANTDFVVEFLGSNEVAKENPPNTAVVVWAEENGEVKWQRDFGNPAMPEGAWNGFRIIEKYKDVIVVAKGNAISFLDATDGNILKEAALGNTPICYILTDEESIYVLSSYYGFDKSRYPSNIICIDGSLAIQWYAELPSPRDIWVSAISLQGNFLLCSSWEGMRCTLDTRTGKIRTEKFTK